MSFSSKNGHFQPKKQFSMHKYFEIDNFWPKKGRFSSNFEILEIGIFIWLGASYDF